MKVSRYNIIVENKKYGNWLLYNSFRNSLIEIDEAVKMYLDAKSKCSGSNCEDGELVSQEDKETLYESGFLIDDDFDELKETIRKDEISYKQLKDPNSLNLTICPTYDCNLKCPYCYEVYDRDLKDYSTMSDEVQDKIIAFYAKYCEKTVANSENGIADTINWYGGEPLLCIDIIAKVQKRLRELATKYNRTLESMIVTNGILLTKENQKILKENEIKTIQVTIDGPEAIHNKRRYFPDSPDESYKIIMSNVRELDDYFHILIRVNIDKENSQYLETFLEDLVKWKIWPNKKNFGTYLASVNTVWDDNYKQAFSQKEFERIKRDFRLQKVKLFNKISPGKKSKLKLDYPTLPKSFCSCTTIADNNSFVIGPDGEIYTCWSNVGNKAYNVGNLNNLIKGDYHEKAKSLRLNPKHRERIGCYSCKIFPICTITCPDLFIQSGDIFRERLCSKWRYSLKDTLLFNYDSQKQSPDLVKELLSN